MAETGLYSYLKGGKLYLWRHNSRAMTANTGVMNVFTYEKCKWKLGCIYWLLQDYYLTDNILFDKKSFNRDIYLYKRVCINIHTHKCKCDVTLKAAPPWMMDLMKMPRSSPVSRDLLPFRLTPNPAEPESLRGTSNISCSFPSSDSSKRACSSFWRENNNDGREWDEEDHSIIKSPLF